MTHSQSNNPLHGVTLEAIVTRLVERYGWAELGRLIPIKCFTHEPSIKSSLKFLRGGVVRTSQRITGTDFSRPGLHDDKRRFTMHR